MASAYLFHLVQNHPFVDGNKRTGTATSLLFLTLNDIEIDLPLQALYEEVIAVAKGESNKSRLAEFFKLYAV
jgi:death-on-curing protein